MSAPAELKVADALGKLIHQFADPLSFYREIIQNSLDAGSEEIEIYLTYEPGKDGSGVTIIHIDDWGIGMTREIIEKRLTRLFSSSKDGDRTKIGKFGIGFVSIFAIEPELVCVDTSREGEHWRVLFTADHKFELRRLEQPVDGTKVRIYKRTGQKEHESLVQRSRATIRYWCKHVRGEVRFHDELLTEPFDLAAPLKIRKQDGASTFVVGHPEDGVTFSGLYNRGLTLIEDAHKDYPRLAFKISSDLLEHTLTRDNVIQDENYFKVSRQLRELVDGPLPKAVFAAIEAALQEPPSDDHLRYLYRAGVWHMERAPLTGQPTSNTVAFTPSGKALPLRALMRGFASDERPLLASARTALTDAVEASDRLVILAPPGAPVHVLLTGFGGPPPLAVGARFCLPEPARDNPEAAHWRPLAAAVLRLLKEHGAKIHSVELARFSDPESTIHDWVAITQRKAGEIEELVEARALGSSFFSRRRTLVLNAVHPTVQSLIALG
ncbi:MAG TPA: hypothetical protein ENJ18_04905 [Nannocystis exedens]|nr:hypothetical protein [Nannocystis exedens]